MKKIDTLSSVEGRKFLVELFHELKYDKQLSGLSVLMLTWKICVREREIFRYSKKEVTVLHPLGFISGSILWMEEIVHRFYFSTVNSFVYLGAAALLVLIGARRFGDNVSEDMVIGGVIFEALMLVFIFVIMLFSPNEDVRDIKTEDDETESSTEELIMEIGEIGRDFAAVVVHLEEIGSSMEELIKQQVNMINSVNRVAENSSQAIAPNPEMLDTMRVTNATLQEFQSSVESFNIAADKLKREEIEIAVRKEVEKVISTKLSK